MRLTTSTFDIMKSDPSLGRAEALRRAMLAYVEALNTPTIRRLTPSCRHQLPPIARVLERELSVFDRGDRPNYEVVLAVIDYFKDYPDSCHPPKEDMIFEVLKGREHHARSQHCKKTEEAHLDFCQDKEQPTCPSRAVEALLRSNSSSLKTQAPSRGALSILLFRYSDYSDGLLGDRL
jgi:hypothetical protein